MGKKHSIFFQFEIERMWQRYTSQKVVDPRVFTIVTITPVLSLDDSSDNLKFSTISLVDELFLKFGQADFVNWTSTTKAKCNKNLSRFLTSQF